MNKKKAKPRNKQPDSRRTASSKAAAGKALAKETERALIDQIRRLQALPMNKRTHFLRVRHPAGGTHL